MRLAWFRATPPDACALLDEGATLIAAMRRIHHIEIVTEADAHDFVWKHDREPYDLCVYEIGTTPAREFPWPYVLHYPGVLILRSMTLADARGWGRSRAIVAADAAVAQSLQADWPEARIRVVPSVPLGSDPGSRQWTVGGGPDLKPHATLTHAASADCPLPTSDYQGLTPARLAILGEGRRDVVERAVARASQRGASLILLAEATPSEMLGQADIVVAMEWPPAAGPPAAARPAMAAGLPVIVLEVEATAAWPALDPQTWLPRGFSTEAPIAVSIDPRDEEHSLMLAIARLAADAGLRGALGAAGQTWWRAHARVDHSSAALEQILHEAARLGPAAAVPVLDGSESARKVLAEFGVNVDFL
ncbi:MAG TPA: hypothetical protein VIX63_16680 [Vicinamibacterales bacterium]